MDDLTRANPSQWLLRNELSQRLQDLYQASTGIPYDPHTNPVANAIIDASLLRGANASYPGIRVLGGYQTINSDSSLTASASTGTNSNQEGSAFGGEIHAANAEVESTSSMSFIPAIDLFPKSDGSSKPSGEANKK